MIVCLDHGLPNFMAARAYSGCSTARHPKDRMPGGYWCSSHRRLRLWGTRYAGNLSPIIRSLSYKRRLRHIRISSMSRSAGSHLKGILTSSA